MLKINGVVVTDTLSVNLQGHAQALQRARGPMAMTGVAFLANWAQQSFEDEWRRVIPWAPVKRGGLGPRLEKVTTILKQSRSLQRSIRAESRGEGSGAVVSDRKYAAFHQYGTKPYTIRPKNKKALFWPGGPGPRARVNHPGLPARPFIPIDANDNLMPQAQDEMLESMRMVLEDMLKGGGAV